MNASALLTSQGWLGPGHALDSRLTDYGAQKYKQKGHRGLCDSTTEGNGLVKPLLISQRGNARHGIGRKSHEPASGNEWWLKGFASALANVGKEEGERSYVPKDLKHTGLYGYFVAGKVMEGTMEGTMEKGTKRKREELKKRESGLEESGRVKKKRSELEGSGREKKRSELKSVEILAKRERRRKKKSDAQSSEDAETVAGIVRNKKLSLAEMVEEELARLSSMNNSEVEEELVNVKRKKRRKGKI